VTVVIITPFFPSAGALSYCYSYLFIEILGLKHLAFILALGILT